MCGCRLVLRESGGLHLPYLGTAERGPGSFFSLLPRCPVRTCPLDEFQCNNTLCKPLAWKCDGEDDCGDNSDENPEECGEWTRRGLQEGVEPQRRGWGSGKGRSLGKGRASCACLSHICPSKPGLSCFLTSQPGSCAHLTGPSGVRTTVSACGLAANATELTTAGMGQMRRIVVSRQ